MCWQIWANITNLLFLVHRENCINCQVSKGSHQYQLLSSNNQIQSLIMFKVLTFGVIGKHIWTFKFVFSTFNFSFYSNLASLLVCYAAATCLVCPQTLTDDTQLPVCASNSYGNTNVTQSAITNWNCNHPNNRKKLVTQYLTQTLWLKWFKFVQNTPWSLLLLVLL